VEIQDALSDVTSNLVSFKKTEPFVHHLFSHSSGAWIDVIQTCIELKLESQLEELYDISTISLLAVWLHFPSDNGEGYRMILFFSEPLGWSNIAIYNAARLLPLG
jgi:hypothetical protein